MSWAGSGKAREGVMAATTRSSGRRTAAGAGSTETGSTGTGSTGTGSAGAGTGSAGAGSGTETETGAGAEIRTPAEAATGPVAELPAEHPAELPVEHPAGSPRVAAERAARHNSVEVRLPLIGTVKLPAKEELAFLGGVGVLAVIGVIEWPVAVAVGAGHTLAVNRRNKVVREFGQALEEV